MYYNIFRNNEIFKEKKIVKKNEKIFLNIISSNFYD
jgi:hypothetical protein